VDLRAMGKRALESLIKVGAMDSFGPRAAMLELLDRMVAVSTSHFRAEQAGQMSLFGGHTGVREVISLPAVPDADRREMLNWERELVGMYLSEHPLTAYIDTLRRVVSYSSATLGEASHGEAVRVAGLISGIRPHQTKTGKMMAWVNLEDLQGTIELVLFPRTWEKYQFQLEIGGVILAEGKVDAAASPSKVLVDAIRTEIQVVVPAGEEPVLPSQEKPLPKKVVPTRPNPQKAPPAFTPMTQAKNPSGEPTPPEAFPPGWEQLEAKAPARPSPAFPAPQRDPEPEEKEPLPVEELQPKRQDPAPDYGALPPAVVLPSVKLNSPTPSGLNLSEDHPPQMITLILRPSGEAPRDARRIGRLHGTFISYPGKDRFQFQIFESGRGHLIDFPNDTTRLCPELIEVLRQVVGEENIRVEPILYL